MSKFMYRHGDVGLEKMDSEEVDFSKLKIRKSDILADGEITGHAHRASGDFQMYEDDYGVLWMKVGKEGAVLTHEEHKKIDVKEGAYKIVIQEEYTPEGYRKVVD